MMLPLGTLLNILVRTGSTTSDEGAIPNVHIIIAPVTTYESAIYYSSFKNQTFNAECIKIINSQSFFQGCRSLLDDLSPSKP